MRNRKDAKAKEIFGEYTIVKFKEVL